VQNEHNYPAMRDLDGKLARWDLPHDHFETNISNFFGHVIEENPEVKYSQSYQATFGGILGTAHMTGEGVVFVYFNHGSKTFERFKISPDHAHRVIPIEKRPPIPPQRPNPTCDNPSRKISYYRLKPIHFGRSTIVKYHPVVSCRVNAL
jgi:hypothetical protein